MFVDQALFAIVPSPRIPKNHVRQHKPLQWHYLPVGRNQFLFGAQQTQMQFDEGKISESKHDWIISVSQITGLTSERFTTAGCSLTSPLLFYLQFLTCLIDASSIPSVVQEKEKKKKNVQNICTPLLFSPPFHLLKTSVQNCDVKTWFKEISVKGMPENELLQNSKFTYSRSGWLEFQHIITQRIVRLYWPVRELWLQSFIELCI